MKQSPTFKSLLIVASLLSLFAFTYVNLRANNISGKPYSTIEMAQTQVEDEDASESGKISVPNMSVLGRVWELAQRLLDRAN
ncbi:MAG: hypothetical protein ACKVT2_13890 [Saprospiraceae bacterium]